MNIRPNSENWTELLRHMFTNHSALILTSVPILLVVYRYYGSSEFFDMHLAQLFCNNPDTLCGSLFSFLCALLLLLLVPATIAKCLLKVNLRALGLQLGNWRMGLRAIAILLPVIIIVALYPASKMDSFRSVYPLFRSAGNEVPLLILFEVLYGCYYFAWEFFFRGYMLFGLKDRLGEAHSILIQTIPSVLMHIGKPDGEIFASFIAGIAFGIIALRTRSIIYVFLLHWLIGISLDLLIIYG